MLRDLSADYSSGNCHRRGKWGGKRRIGENTALNAVNQQVRRARRRRANKGGREGKTLEGFTGGGRAIYLPAGLFLF